MIDLWLLVLILIVVMVVAIEGMPDGFVQKAEKSAVPIIAAAMRFFQSVFSICVAIVKGIGLRIGQSQILRGMLARPTFTAPSLRVVGGAIVAAILSPIAAIPVVIVFAALLYALGYIGGDELSLVSNQLETIRFILGNAFVFLVATLDLLFRWAVLALPLILGLGFAASKLASRSPRFVRKLTLYTLMTGAIYPVVFLLATAFGAFNEPIFN